MTGIRYNHAMKGKVMAEKAYTSRMRLNNWGLRIEASDTAILTLAFLKKAPPRLHSDASEAAAPILHAAIRQVKEYLLGRRIRFDLPYTLPVDATPFQRAVWSAAEKIPYGETITYGGLADMIGNCPRAVGGALRSNPLPLLVPCHRIVGARQLGGFGGKRFPPIKRFLLDLEGSSYHGG